MIVLVPIYGLARTYLNKKLLENDYHFLNLTWVSWKEFRILLKTDIEDIEEVIASFGKNLLPWEKRFLAWVRESLPNNWVIKLISVVIGVSVGLALGIAITWILPLF